MVVRSKLKKYLLHTKLPIKTYVPKKKVVPKNILSVVTAWKGLELIIEDIMERFNVGTESCIEFGVEFGYSSVVFSNYFDEVVGVDIFLGDEHTAFKGDHFDKTKDSLSKYKNIHLHRSDYKDWIKADKRHYDFAHVDIVHNYDETYECGLWAAQHSTCVVFHDTESFPEVRRAVIDIAKAVGKNVYNYPYHNGLGIIT